MKTNSRLTAALVMAIGSLCPLGATTIFQTTAASGTSDTTLAFNASSGGFFVTESFILTSSFGHVNVMANLSNGSTSSQLVSVFLTNQVGTGTTALANQYTGGSANVSVSASSTDLSTLLFSNLTLGAGTYFLTFASASTNLVSIETSTNSAAPLTAVGVTAGQYGTAAAATLSYDPAASFATTTLGTGKGDAFVTITSTPEPMSLTLIGLGLLAIGWRARRNPA